MRHSALIIVLTQYSFVIASEPESLIITAGKSLLASYVIYFSAEVAHEFGHALVAQATGLGVDAIHIGGIPKLSARKEPLLKVGKISLWSLFPGGCTDTKQSTDKVGRAEKLLYYGAGPLVEGTLSVACLLATSYLANKYDDSNFKRALLPYRIGSGITLFFSLLQFLPTHNFPSDGYKIARCLTMPEPYDKYLGFSVGASAILIPSALSYMGGQLGKSVQAKIIGELSRKSKITYALIGLFAAGYCGCFGYNSCSE